VLTAAPVPSHPSHRPGTSVSTAEVWDAAPARRVR